MMLTITEIIKFLKNKGVEYRFEEKDIVLKHCPIHDHAEHWSTIIWFEKDKNNWFFMCQNPEYDMFDIVPLSWFMRLCDHDIDLIRNRNKI